MRTTFLICGLLFSIASEARDYTYDIEQAQRACSIERSSQLRERKGTPSCEKVNQLIQLQQMEKNSDAERERLKTEAEVSRETGQPMPSHNYSNVTTTVVNQESDAPRLPGHIEPRRIYDAETRKSCVVYTDGSVPAHCN
jgi:hypothetical protein